MHFWDSCEERTAPRWWLSKKMSFGMQETSEFGIAVLFSQVTPPKGHRSMAACLLHPRSRLHYYWRIVSFPQFFFWMKCLETGFYWESAMVREILNPILNSLAHVTRARWASQSDTSRCCTNKALSIFLPLSIFLFYRLISPRFFHIHRYIQHSIMHMRC